MSFDRVIVVDWSAASRLQPVPRADSIWFGIEEAGRAWTEHLPGRRAAEARLEALTATGRVLVGFDFPLAGPAGLAERLTGREDPAALRDWLDARIVDGADNRNNRFEVAAGVNRLLGAPAFWGRPATLDLADLPARKTCDYAALGLPERRRVEELWRGTQPFWKLYTTGSVGSQALVGMPVVARLARRAGVTVWPWDGSGRVVLAEVWPSILAAEVRAAGDPIRDRAQVRLLARALWRMGPSVLEGAEVGAEGWILGIGHEAALREAAG